MFFKFPIEAANDIFKYLATRPYAEVAGLIDGMKVGTVIEDQVVAEAEVVDAEIVDGEEVVAAE
jgi:hypothetical protein